MKNLPITYTQIKNVKYLRQKGDVLKLNNVYFFDDCWLKSLTINTPINKINLKATLQLLYSCFNIKI